MTASPPKYKYVACAHVDSRPSSQILKRFSLANVVRKSWAITHIEPQHSKHDEYNILGAKRECEARISCPFLVCVADVMRDILLMDKLLQHYTHKPMFTRPPHPKFNLGA